MQNKYDIIIIGSGLSGLVCGYILSKEGYKVCILEKNKQIGGCLQTYARDKRIFDVGVHYIGGLDKGQSLNQYFQYLGIMDDLKLERMDMDAFDVITFDGDETEYKMAQGYERFVDSLSQQFPTEREAIKTFAKEVEGICHKFPLYFLDVDKSYPDTQEHWGINARDKIASITQNKDLQAVLAGNSLLYAGRGAATPFYLYAMVLNGYIESSWRCVDGGSQIARLLLKQIRKNGGELHKRKEVDHFVFSGDKIKAVHLTSGEEIDCDHVVSSAHPSQLEQFTKGSKGHLRKAFLNRILTTPPTPPAFCAHYTLKPDSFPYINYNCYHSANKDVWNLIEHNHKNWPSTYMALTPKTSTSGNYADSFSAMTYMEYDEVKQWENSFNSTAHEESRGSDYEDFKAKKAERLLEELYKKFPTLKGNILNTYTSSPLSFRDYIGSPTGSFYGFQHSSQNPMRTMFSTQTRIPNLVLTGQNVNVHGILGVTVSAVLSCCNFIERKKLLTDIVSA